MFSLANSKLNTLLTYILITYVTGLKMRECVDEDEEIGIVVVVKDEWYVTQKVKFNQISQHQGHKVSHTKYIRKVEKIFQTSMMPVILGKKLGRSCAD
jgi:hypothetical protein